MNSQSADREVSYKLLFAVDLKLRQIYTMEACPGDSFTRPGYFSHPLFRFANLLEICDEASLERFTALVETEEAGVKEATAGSKGRSS